MLSLSLVRLCLVLERMRSRPALLLVMWPKLSCLELKSPVKMVLGCDEKILSSSSVEGLPEGQ